MHGKPISVDPYYGIDCELVTIKKPFLYGESFCIRPFGLFNFCSNF